MTIVPGVWDVTQDEYHADRACDSFTTLKCFADSAVLYEATYVSGLFTEDEKKDFLIGRALHLLVLEGWDTFQRSVCSMPNVDGRTKEGKAAKQLFAAENAGKIVLTHDDYALVCAMADGVMRNGHAAALLAMRGRTELAVRWQDPDTGLWMKSRFDKLIADEQRLILDLKSTDDPCPRGWAWSFKKFRYYQQAAIYIEAAGKALSLPDCDFLFLTVGKKPPFDCVVYRPTYSSLERGLREVKGMMTQLALRKFLGNWRSDYADQVVDIDLPAFE